MEGIDKNKMEKTIAINAGSSSLKFQLYDMPSERVITAGIVERIGLKDSIFTITVDGEKIKEIIDIPDHEIAVQMLLEKLINHKVIGSYDEITGIGHRVVHGGERFPESVYIDDQVIKDIEALSELAPLHNPANVTGIKAFRKILQTLFQWLFSIQLSIKQCLQQVIFTACHTAIMKTMVSVNTVSTVQVTNMYPNALQNF